MCTCVLVGVEEDCTCVHSSHLCAQPMALSIYRLSLLLLLFFLLFYLFFFFAHTLFSDILVYLSPVVVFSFFSKRQRRQCTYTRHSLEGFIRIYIYIYISTYIPPFGVADTQPMIEAKVHIQRHAARASRDMSNDTPPPSPRQETYSRAPIYPSENQ